MLKYDTKFNRFYHMPSLKILAKDFSLKVLAGDRGGFLLLKIK